MADTIHPKHYSRLSPEPIDLIHKWELNFNLGCVIKYISRAGHKGDHDQHVEDLKKAMYYLQHEIDRVANRKPKGDK